MKRIFVTGIGTDIGKTIASAILVETLKADYWKPVQAGDLENTDTLKVKSLISNSQTIFHPESFMLSKPMSPHAAAAYDNIEIKESDISPPKQTKTLIIEGAGGLLVPLNKKFLMIDLIQQLKAEVVLVSKNYLGSINHTLLSAEALKNRNIPIKGIIFNGSPVNTTETFICEYTGLNFLFRIDNEEIIDKQTILKYASKPNIKSLVHTF